MKKSFLRISMVGVAVVAALGVAPAMATPITVIDIIPNGQSSETGQNSEPSLAVDPLNPNNIIAGAFSVFNNTSPVTVTTPFWQSNNGGTTWSGFGNLLTLDKSIAYRQDGVAALTTTLSLVNGNNNSPLQIQTFQSGASNFGSAINTFNPSQNLDQPWVRTGPSGQTYVAYNNLSNAGGRSASVIVSANNGSTYGSPVTLETVNPVGGQDAPSVRMAVNGSTVYAAFTRWGTQNTIDPNPNAFQATYSNSQVVIAKSTNSGASFGAGVTAATTTGYFGDTSNTALTLGQNRTSSDIAIAVDPNNANHVIVAYGDASGASGQLRLHVTESTNGGATWTEKFVTASTVRSGLPGLSILNNGAIGLLYLSYDPHFDSLTQHFLTTTNDFATTSDIVLGTESNATPALAFFPYLGDYYDLTSINDTFYGIFSASNADNGTDALFANVSFQRDFTGTPGTGSFQLTNVDGRPVASSIDPFFFAANFTAVPAPEPATLALLGLGLAGLGFGRRKRAS